MDTNLMCRLCAKPTESSDVIFLFGNDPHCIDWREKIKKCSPIKLEENPDNNLPQNMCLHCSEKLEACSKFWQQCELADKMILAKLDVKQKPVPLEETGKNSPKIKRGSYYCVAKWCNSNNVSCSSMFRLPKGSRGKEWLNRADRPDLLDMDDLKLNRKYLCGKHFTKECFLKSNLLTWNAVPTIFEDCKYLSKSSSQNTQPSEVVKDLQTVQKLRPLLPAPAKFTNEARNTLDEANSSSVLLPTTSQNHTSEYHPMKITKCVGQVSSAIPFVNKTVLINRNIDEINQSLVCNQSNDNNILIVFPNESVNSVKLQNKNNDVLKNDRRTILSVENFQKHSLVVDKNTSTMCDKRVKVDSVIDGIEMFNDIEGLVSGQSYNESMLPCSGCGEVFLMSSSLYQHQQRYHSEHFDDNSST